MKKVNNDTLYQFQYKPNHRTANGSINHPLHIQLDPSGNTNRERISRLQERKILPLLHIPSQNILNMEIEYRGGYSSGLCCSQSVSLEPLPLMLLMLVQGIKTYQ